MIANTSEKVTMNINVSIRIFEYEQVYECLFEDKFKDECE